MAHDRTKPGYVEQVRDNTRRYIEDLLRENVRLRGELDEQTRRFQERYAEVEQQNSALASLYAASYQLHATLRRAEVLLAIEEIVINLVGSEQLVVMTGDAAGGFGPAASVGVDPDRVRIDHPVIARALSAGAPALAEAPDPDGITACVPLRVDGRAIGFIAIFRLLPQKAGLGALDRELLELLATHAATALYCAGLHEGARG